MPGTAFPARLHVLLARESKVALVIRRGPSKSVCTVLWNRERDTFKLGQWLRGRIYERRTDLSPDGKHFIYFAMNGRWESETEGSWTAISRVPHLKAVTLFAKGDCWFGGGLFLSDKEYWLNDDGRHRILKDSHEVRRNPSHRPQGYYGGECPNVYYNRLQRDGWILKSEDTHGAVIFEKKLPKSWILRKLAFAETGAPTGRGCYWDGHELEQVSTGTRLVFPEWEWADFDRGRVVWTANGQLRAARLASKKLAGEKLLRDFNDMKFKALAAPY